MYSNCLHETVVRRAELLFLEVLNAMSQMAENKIGKSSVNSTTKVLPSRCQITDLEDMLLKEKANSM